MSFAQKTFTKSFDSSSSSNLPETYNLLLKLYASLLNNNIFNNGLKKITRLSQPVIGKVDDSLFAFKSNLGKWLAHENIFTQLASLWLSDNLPFHSTSASYEEFIKKSYIPEVISTGRNEETSKTFYNIACEMWESLNDPKLDDIRNAILAVVAKVINKTYLFEEGSLATALYNMLIMLVEKKQELISARSFFNLVRMSLEKEYFERHQLAIKTACYEYYSFAKKFLLLHFPLMTNNKGMLNIALNFLQENLVASSFSTLDFFERQLDLLLRFCGQKPQEIFEDKNLSEKAQRIVKKSFMLSMSPFYKMESALRNPKEIKIVAKIDNYLHVSEKIDDTVVFAALGYMRLKENLLEPVFNYIKVTTNATKTQVVVIMHGLSLQAIKKRYTKLRNQFRVLQKCAMMFEDDAVKMIFDEKSRAELSSYTKKELVRFYEAVKTLERQKIENVTMEYYSQLLKKAKKTYNRANKLVYYHGTSTGGKSTSNRRAVKRVGSLKISSFESETNSETSMISTVSELAS